MNMRYGWVLLNFITSLNAGYCAPTVGENLSHCQSTYGSVTSEMKGTTDDVTKTIWRLFFHDIDLDGNGHLAASELTLFLESKGYVHESDVMAGMKESEDWMEFGGYKNQEISTNEFKKSVEKSMVTSIESTKSYYHTALSICEIFNHRVPHIIESLTDLETCTKSLEASTHASSSGKSDFHGWFAIFETLDSNSDNKIGFEELKKTGSSDDLPIASALGHAIYGTVQHGVTDVTESDFYVFVHELLYGMNGDQRQHSWSDVYDVTELEGRAMLCNVIYDVRKTIAGQHDVMADCVKSYEAIKEKILGADGVFAPEIVFTMADLNRDGKISQKEFDAFIGTQSSSLYSAIERKHAGKDMRIDDFRSVMPDQIFDSDVTSKLQLTSMTSWKLSEAEMLCHAITASVQKYPSHNGRIAIDHVIPEMSFKGVGEYIDLPNDTHTGSVSPTPSHSLSPEQHFMGIGHHIDTGITPLAPTRGPDSSGGVVYHMFDDNGNPIVIHVSKSQIGDIVHEMSPSPTESPIHNERLSTSQSRKSAAPPSGEKDDGLVNEISKILHKRIREETDEEAQLKKLLESLESSEITDA